ncbi:MAG: DUF3373 domain-containing protein [Proteobacteria bacterium]|nr:DUF3373 domain-containing protein [Pseudomonadota bacterium]
MKRINMIIENRLWKKWTLFFRFWTTLVLAVLLLGRESLADEVDIQWLQKEVEELRAHNVELEERLERIEKHSASDRIQLNGELRAIHHRLNHSEEVAVANPGGRNRLPGQERLEESDYFNQLRLRLNLRTRFTHDIRFSGRLSMYKNWGENTLRSSKDPGVSGNPGDSTLRVERAYVDYFLNPTWSFTFGRLPTSEGPPMELTEHTTRKSTYPATLYEIEMDGMGLSAELPTVSVLKPAFRFVYGEVGGIESTTPFEGGSQNIPVFIYQLEAEFESSRTEGILILDHMNISDYRVTLSASLEGQNMDPADYRLEGDSSVPLADFEVDLLHVQFTNIEQSGLDIYTSFAWTVIKSNGNRLVILDRQSNARFQCMGVLQSTNCNVPAEKRTEKGQAINFGMRFTLPSALLAYPKIGMDYHTASEWYLALAARSEYGDPDFEFFNIRGESFHIYWIQPLNPSLFLRIGRRDIAPRYDNDLFGDNPAHKQRLINSYVLINARF